MEKKKGYVYILTNPSFREDWVKIGKSSRPVNVRSKELDNTAVPLPFEIYATLQTEKYNEVEKLVHRTIDRLTDLRIRSNREFFNVTPATALSILCDIATTLDDAVLDSVYLKNEKLEIEDSAESIETKKRANFSFNMVGIKPGEKVVFIPTKIEVKVVDEKHIEYEDRLWSLSGFTANYLPVDKRNNANAYQGPKYFSYNGKTLSDLRAELENNE